jgi:hypothetical protein
MGRNLHTEPLKRKTDRRLILLMRDDFALNPKRWGQRHMCQNPMPRFVTNWAELMTPVMKANLDCPTLRPIRHRLTRFLERGVALALAGRAKGAGFFRTFAATHI